MRSSRVDVDTQGSGRCSTLRASFCVRAVSFIARMEHVWVFGSLWVLRFRQAVLEARITRLCPTTGGVAPVKFLGGLKGAGGDNVSGTLEAWVVRNEVL